MAPVVVVVDLEVEHGLEGAECVGEAEVDLIEEELIGVIRCEIILCKV